MSKWMLSSDKSHIVDLEGNVIVVIGDEEVFQQIIMEHNSQDEIIGMLQDLYSFMSSLRGKNACKAENRLESVLGKIHRNKIETQ